MDWLQLLDIIVTAGVGIWIGVIVQNNFTQNRNKRGFFIDELKDIKKLYSLFLTKLFNDNYSGRSIVQWNKIMSERLKVLEKHLQESYVLDNHSVVTAHFEFSSFLTGTQELNESWSKKLILSEKLQNEVLIKYGKLSEQINSSIIYINKCKEKRQ